MPKADKKKYWNVKCINPFRYAGAGSLWCFDGFVENGEVMKLRPKNMALKPILIHRKRFDMFFKFIRWGEVAE